MITHRTSRTVSRRRSIRRLVVVLSVAAAIGAASLVDVASQFDGDAGSVVMPLATRPATSSGARQTAPEGWILWPNAMVAPSRAAH